MRYVWVGGAVASLALTASSSSAQVCDSSPANRFDYDPMTTTRVVPSDDLWNGVFRFQSPESPDPLLVYHVGHPNGDGCIAGIQPGSTDPTGALDLAEIYVYCVHFEIESALPPRIDLFRWDGSSSNRSHRRPSTSRSSCRSATLAASASRPAARAACARRCASMTWGSSIRRCRRGDRAGGR